MRRGPQESLHCTDGAPSPLLWCPSFGPPMKTGNFTVLMKCQPIPYRNLCHSWFIFFCVALHKPLSISVLDPPFSIIIIETHLCLIWERPPIIQMECPYLWVPLLQSSPHCPFIDSQTSYICAVFVLLQLQTGEMAVGQSNSLVPSLPRPCRNIWRSWLTCAIPYKPLSRSAVDPHYPNTSRS